MDIKQIIAKLHPLERQVLPSLKTENKLKKICQSSKLKEVEVMRALQWLENKEALKINTEKQQLIQLEKIGQHYKEHCLPEKTFLSNLNEDWKGLNVITKKSKLSREEINACLGLLKRKQAIETKKGETLQITINDKGKKLLQQTSKN